MIYYWCTVIAAVRYLRQDQSVRDGGKEDRPGAIVTYRTHRNTLSQVVVVSLSYFTTTTTTCYQRQTLLVHIRVFFFVVFLPS